MEGECLEGKRVFAWEGDAFVLGGRWYQPQADLLVLEWTRGEQCVHSVKSISACLSSRVKRVRVGVEGHVGDGGCTVAVCNALRVEEEGKVYGSSLGGKRLMTLTRTPRQVGPKRMPLSRATTLLKTPKRSELI